MADAIRALAIDAVERANSGHPGLPLGMADVATVLWTRFLKFDAADPRWPDRDRFVLSAGHGSMLLYALLHLTGHAGMGMDVLERFRQLHSAAAGHPEYGAHPAIETTTGPLGQGIATAVGMALGERMLAARFGRSLVDHRTWVIASDGDLMEGISHEAASLAGHLRLDKLTVLYDDNHISIDGATRLATSDDALKRFAAYGWATKRIDGHDPAQIAAALSFAVRSKKPTLIACRTIIGFGAPHKAGTNAAHGSALGAAEAAATKAALGWTAAPFTVPEDLAQAWQEAGGRGATPRRAWLKRATRHPQRAEFERALAGRLPDNWLEKLAALKAEIAESKPKLATRQSSQKVLEALVPLVPELIGGSADLTGSNLTRVKDMAEVAPGQFAGRYLHFGIREHAMAAAMNGMAAHGMVRPYGGTFLVFSDYMRPSVRLAALMELPVTFVFTHDSIGLGEDGPTHQPVEHIAALELIPNLHLVRPADANETRLAWVYAAKAQDHPTALVLSRQKLPVLADVPEDGVQKGVYVLREPKGAAQVGLLASGSEVSIALAAADLLSQEGIGARVLSAPCVRAFTSRPKAEQEATLPKDLPHVAVLAGNAAAFLPLLGPRHAAVDLEHYGASAPAERLYEEFSITPQAVAAAAKSLL